MATSMKKTSFTKSAIKASEEAQNQQSEEEFVQDGEEEDDPTVEMSDESLLSTDQKAAKITQIYLQNFLDVWLAVSLWVIVNVFNNNLEVARSKNPQKDNSFNKIVNSEDLHPDLKGAVLRRWVSAAIVWQEMGNAGIDTEKMEYSHFREIAKIPTLKGRISVGEVVVAGSLTVIETMEAVKTEITKGQPAGAGDADLCGLAQAVIEKLDDPVWLSEQEDFCEVLLDSTQLRAEFHFREQSKIYDKAESVKKQNIKEKSRLEQRLEVLQQSINFLDKLMSTFDGKDLDEKKTA